MGERGLLTFCLAESSCLALSSAKPVRVEAGHELRRGLVAHLPKADEQAACASPEEGVGETQVALAARFPAECRLAGAERYELGVESAEPGVAETEVLLVVRVIVRYKQPRFLIA